MKRHLESAHKFAAGASGSIALMLAQQKATPRLIGEVKYKLRKAVEEINKIDNQLTKEKLDGSRASNHG